MEDTLIDAGCSSSDKSFNSSTTSEHGIMNGVRRSGICRLQAPFQSYLRPAEWCFGARSMHRQKERWEVNKSPEVFLDTIFNILDDMSMAEMQANLHCKSLMHLSPSREYHLNQCGGRCRRTRNCELHSSFQFYSSFEWMDVLDICICRMEYRPTSFTDCTPVDTCEVLITAASTGVCPLSVLIPWHACVMWFLDQLLELSLHSFCCIVWQKNVLCRCVVPHYSALFFAACLFPLKCTPSGSISSWVASPNWVLWFNERSCQPWFECILQILLLLAFDFFLWMLSTGDDHQIFLEKLILTCQPLWNLNLRNKLNSSMWKYWHWDLLLGQEDICALHWEVFVQVLSDRKKKVKETTQRMIHFTSLLPVVVILISVTSSSTMFTYSSKPRRVPTISVSPCNDRYQNAQTHKQYQKQCTFIIIQILEPMHLSIKASGWSREAAILCNY